MKTSHTAALAAALLAMCATTTRTQASETLDPSIPVGALDAYPTIVQTGTNPTLTWGIEYPETVLDVVDIDPDGTVTPKECLDMELRVLGASVRASQNKWLTVEAYSKIEGVTSWNRIFRGTQKQVDPTTPYYTQRLSAGQAVQIGGRCYDSGWYPFYATGSGSWNVVALVDGDTPPDTVPAFGEQRIEQFLRPYLDASGRVEIGPKDVIFLFELAMTHPSQSNFDLQDLVVLASFQKCATNNGHGNNLDGVDASNPGLAPFLDTSDPIDDEAGAGVGAYPSLN